MTGSWHFRAAAFAFLCCILLGGGTRPGFLSDAILQIACVPVLCWSLWSLCDVRLPRWTSTALVICGVVVLLPLMQLVPLPLRFWQAFPVRAGEIAVLDLLGQSPSSLAITVSPQATLLSLLSLVAPLTVFVAALLLSAHERRLMTLLLVAAGVGSAFLGLAQLSQGPSSALRFYEVTNPDDAVGFFANRNHFATFINCAIVFAVGWTLELASTAWSAESSRTRASLNLSLALSAIVILIAAATTARSRAGVLGTVIALVCGFALAMRGRRSGTSLGPMRALGVASGFGLILVLQFAVYRLMDRFAVDPLMDVRRDFARVTLEAIKAYFPLGSGIGTFTRVYPTFETPSTVLLDTYVNRAHNDFLEFALEAGLPGGLLIAAIGGLAIMLGWRAWTRRDAGARLIDATLVRCATIAIAIIAIHSALDYPLRTNAMMGVAALMFAMLLPMPSRPAGDTRPSEFLEAVRPGRAPRPEIAVAVTPEVPTSPRAPWGEGIEWPTEWQKGNPKKPGT